MAPRGPARGRLPRRGGGAGPGGDDPTAPRHVVAGAEDADHEQDRLPSASRPPPWSSSLFVGAQLLRIPAMAERGGRARRPAAAPPPSPTAGPAPELPSIRSRSRRGTYLVTDRRSPRSSSRFPAGWDGRRRRRQHPEAPRSSRTSYALTGMYLRPRSSTCGRTHATTRTTAADAPDRPRMSWWPPSAPRTASDASEPAEHHDGRTTPGSVASRSPFRTAWTRLRCDPAALANLVECWRTTDNFLAFGGPGTAPIYIVETPTGRIVLGTGTVRRCATATDQAGARRLVHRLRVQLRAPRQ